jgi:pseudouridine-5'-phosphate glycosidase
VIINFSSEVKEALSSGGAVVALESTVIAHGLPYPNNIETALRCEAAVRISGAVPATIAIIGGEFRVGLSRDEIEFLASGSDIRKASTRDLSIAVANKLNCATTVSTTAFIAHRSGIKVFATGGIGGVHRGYPADVSADLPMLAETPVMVVCSGAKMILDIAATREWLETHGVAVLGWQCDEMPAFYSRSSGLNADHRVDSASDAALVTAARDALGMRQATLMTVPVPKEFELPRDEMESIISAAIAEVDRQGISGKDVTPFLLSELTKASGGRTLKANIALLENNARVAGLVAVQIANRIT